MPKKKTTALLQIKEWRRGAEKWKKKMSESERKLLPKEQHSSLLFDWLQKSYPNLAAELEYSVQSNRSERWATCPQTKHSVRPSLYVSVQADRKQEKSPTEERRRKTKPMSSRFGWTCIQRSDENRHGIWNRRDGGLADNVLSSNCSSTSERSTPEQCWGGSPIWIDTAACSIIN